jgi:hypothetical protein
MNVPLLESVRHAIIHYPARFSAAQWAFARNERAVIDDGATPNGFKCCIAGHVLLESGAFSERELLQEGGFHSGGHLWEQAAEALGLDAACCRELFFPSQWDKPYKQNYYLCPKREEAEVAASYIDYFVAKHAVPADGPTVEAPTTDAAAPAADRRVPATV